MFRQRLNRFLGLPQRSPLRPPGAIPEQRFVDACIKCAKCAQVCPYDSIEMTSLFWGDKQGTPVIHAREVPCYLCMECPPVCPSGALDANLADKREVAMGTAVIDRSRCLAYHGVICRSCFERCPMYREAIVLRDELYPEVQPDACVGCGICEHVCPAEEEAITVRSSHEVLA